MYHFVVKQHSVNPGEEVVSVFQHGALVATIYGHEAEGIRVVSKYMKGSREEAPTGFAPEVKTVIVELEPQGGN